MKILILEDDKVKLEKLTSVVNSLNIDVELTFCEIYSVFSKKIVTHKYDLVVSDLIVPIFPDSKEGADISTRLHEDIRDMECMNFYTPVIAVTKFSDIADQCMSKLNRFDITVITYDEINDDWKKYFSTKVQSCVPAKSYFFVIVCALEKEAGAYLEAGYVVGDIFIYQSVSCREITINNLKGVIITPQRMGLVNSAITSARVIDLFKPKLICMSGICAGIEGKANIYDVIIPNICYQHDSGKWTSDGFIPESYAVQLESNTSLKINKIIKEKDFINSIKNNVMLNKTEFADSMTSLDFNVYLAPTSSGSSVVADDEILCQIKNQHRKHTAFEMESYALYEAARLAFNPPIFFSAKSVVDNGNTLKGDEFHRVACLLSAKTVCEIIKRGVIS